MTSNKTPLWFQKWRNGEFVHFKINMTHQVRLSIWLSSIILATIIGSLVLRFFFG